jgi:HAE1 family hydrophobic/amphiphilic exporter-1/multidrug efflux pump
MIIRTLADGSILRMRDVARTELSARTYSSFGRRNGAPAVLLIVYQLPGANALETAEAVTHLLEDVKKTFPPGLEYEITLDTTKFVEVAIDEVIHALRDAIVLVLIVVFIFLGNLRATFIPMLAVPVSLVGTFAAFVALGFSINTLTMLALVLAVGIVVDDAIVVVEAVEHHIQHGLTPLEATEKAMTEVSGALIAIALVLCSVFVPVAFMGGIVGVMYRQFALTLSISVLLSVLCALTLTPALCQMMLRPRKEMRGPVGAFLRGFNRLFDRVTKGYLGIVGLTLRRMAFALAALVGIYLGAGALARTLPTGFVPEEDQGYFFAVFQLPDGASMERTDSLMRRAEDDARKVEGVASVVTFGGLNLLNNSYTSNSASMIFILKPWEDRTGAEVQLNAIAAKLRRAFGAYPEAAALVFAPPALPGLGNAGGFTFQLQDRGGNTPQDLSAVAREFIQKAAVTPHIVRPFSTFTTDVPQIRLDIDREKVRTLGIPINTVFQALQIYLGGLQVNDLNLFGRTYKVMVQAEPEFRATPQNIKDIYVRGQSGSMVPLSTLSSLEMMSGPDLIQRHNMYRAAEISGSAAPGSSSGQALAAMEELARRELPQGYSFDWSGLSFQEKSAGGTAGPILVMALIFVFLVLAAQYESWAVPFSVLFGLPIGIFGAFLFVWLRGVENNVFVQVGIISLMGLAAKNAILIVEFAKDKHEKAGMPLREAALEAAKLRFRPILMTAFAFVLGVIPLYVATGAGSASRVAIGTSVFGGMLIATVIGLFFIPMLYVLVQELAYKVSGPKTAKAPVPEPAPEGAAPHA